MTMTSKNVQALSELKHELLKLKETESDSHLLDLSKTPLTPSTANETVEECRRAFEVNGLVLIRGAISSRSLDEARGRAAAAVRKDFSHLLPEQETSSDPFELDAYRSAKCGRGNAAFGFLFRQPDTWDPRCAPCATVAGEETAFAKSSSYADCNIRLISHDDNQRAFALLYALTDREAMVSADSVKLCSFRTPSRVPEGAAKHTPTARKYTRAHIDKYTDELDRHQAMVFGLNEGDVTLCFVRFAHLASIQRLIAIYLGDESFFTSAKGFFVCNDEALFDIFRETGVIVVPSPTDLVIWKAGVIHAELHRDTLKVEGKRAIKDGRAERYLVGTHIPKSLSEKDLKKLALLANEGYVPHPYLKNGPCVEQNNVSKKKTLYRKNSLENASEKAHVRQIDTLSYSEINSRFGGLAPRVQQCFGVSQASLDELFSDKTALAVFGYR